MKDTQEKQLFTEITTEESATVNGGSCGYYGGGYGYRNNSYYGGRRYYNRSVNYGYNRYGYNGYRY